MNTNGGTDNLITLKCKLKCQVKSVKSPQGVTLVEAGTKN